MKQRWNPQLEMRFRRRGKIGLFTYEDILEWRKNERKNRMQRLKNLENQNIEKSISSVQSKNNHFQDQPRSAFRFFMEEFRFKYYGDEFLKVDKNGYEKWKAMSKEEREEYIEKAKIVNDEYSSKLNLNEIE